jgi:hypothetical protein
LWPCRCWVWVVVRDAIRKQHNPGIGRRIQGLGKLLRALAPVIYPKAS